MTIPLYFLHNSRKKKYRENFDYLSGFFLPRSGSEKNNSRSWKKFLFQPDPEVLNTAEMYHQRYLILSTYSEVFWLAMLEGAMCSLKSGPKYSK